MTNIDETKLTAYALGELDDNEAAEVEAHLSASPDARRTVEEIRNVAGLLTNELANEPAPALTAEQRRAIAGRARPGRLAAFLRPLVSAAAALLVVAIAAGLFLPRLTAERNDLRRQVAQLQDQLALADQPDEGAGPQPVDPTGETPSPVRPNLEVPATDPSDEGSLARAERIREIRSESAEVRERVVRREVVLRQELHESRDAGVGVDTWASETEQRERLAGFMLPPTDEDADGLLDFRQRSGEWDREGYEHIVDNPFLAVMDNPLSTFSIDVDTASYANVRRMLNAGQLPPPGAVRIEELINYFDYAYTPPAAEDEHPFAAHMAVTQCPWQPEHKLARIAIKGYEIIDEQRPPGNFVFLLDVSGSMNKPNKLPLVRSAMKMLVGRLSGEDRLAIVVYAGAAGLVLDSTACDEKADIIAAIDSLTPGGSTHGSAGIKLAYEVAGANFIEGGVNRVILCTDGDFNVGTTSDDELVSLIEEKAKSGVFLTVLGFGVGNYQDAKLEKLADKGNGNYGYIDTVHEARKMLVEQLSGTLITIAKDVKIQVEFNPAKVAAYRLIGYENRILAKEDFNDDTKDAGEIGAGHTVTALYELVPAGEPVPTTGEVDELRYQRPAEALTDEEFSDELLTLKLRYKQPDGEVSTLMQIPVADLAMPLGEAPEDMRFAAAVAEFGMILRGSPYKGNATMAGVIEAATAAKGEDPNGYRAEFVQLAKLAGELTTANEE